MLAPAIFLGHPFLVAAKVNCAVKARESSGCFLHLGVTGSAATVVVVLQDDARPLLGERQWQRGRDVT